MDPALAERLASCDTRCPRCGYNLRHLTVPTCPECGAHFTLKQLDLDHSPLDTHTPVMRLFWGGLVISMLSSLGVVVLALASSNRVTLAQVALLVAGSLGFVVYCPSLAAVRVLTVTYAHQASIDRTLTAMAWAPVVSYPAIFALASFF